MSLDADRALRSWPQRRMESWPLRILDERGAAFDPVAVVAVDDVAVGADFGGVDVAADDAVDAPPARLGDDRLLVVADVLDRVLDLVLQVLRQGPVGKAELPADDVEPDVELQREDVGVVADERQPLRVFDDGVELVAVDDQEAAAVGGLVDRLAEDGDPAEPVADEITKALVMIPRHQDDAGALAGLAQDLLDDVVVRLVPVPGLAHPPDVENVADQVQVVGLGVPQEVQEKVGLAAAGAQMDVGNPDGAVVPDGLRDCVHSPRSDVVSAKSSTVGHSG